MKLWTILAAGGLAVLGTQAAAQDKIFSDSTLGYAQLSGEGGEVDLTFFSVAGAYDVGAFNFAAALDSFKFEGVGEGELGATGLSVNLGYAISPAFSVNAAFAHIELDEDQSDFVELSATYDGGPYWVTVMFGQSDDGDFLAEEYYGVSGGYDFGQGTEIVLAYYDSNEDGFEPVTAISALHQSGPLEIEADLISSEDVSYFKSSASYDVTPQISVLAGYDLIDFDGDSVSTISLGGAYEFAPGLEAFAKLSRIDGDGPEADGIAIGVTYVTGTPTLRTEGSYDRIIRPVLFDSDGIPLL